MRLRTKYLYIHLFAIIGVILLFMSYFPSTSTTDALPIQSKNQKDLSTLNKPDSPNMVKAAISKKVFEKRSVRPKKVRPKSFKKLFQKIGTAFKKIGHGIKNVAKKIGHGIKNAAKKIGHGIVKAAKGVGRFIKKYGLKIAGNILKYAIKFGSKLIPIPGFSALGSMAGHVLGTVVEHAAGGARAIRESLKKSFNPKHMLKNII